MLHQLDPRVKLFASLVMVVLSFAASSWWQLLWVASVVVMGLSFLKGAWGELWRVLWSLKWLIVFSLLFHLLFTPGRTLFGTRWLSYDGLLFGGLVCTQLVLSVSFATVFALTTRTEAIVASVGWFLKPLAVLGLDVRSFQSLLLQVLYFLPEVQSHLIMSASNESGHAVEEEVTVFGRWHLWMTKIKVTILGLIDRGDEIAHSMVENEESSEPVPGQALLPSPSLVDHVGLLLLASIIAVYWIVGGLA